MALFTKKSADTASVLAQTEALYQRGVTTVRDIVAPTALEVTANFVKVGERYARTLFVFNYPRYLNTGWLAPLINLDQSMDISLHVHPVDTSVVLKNLRKKIAEIESQIAMREEKGLVRDPILETAYQDIEELRDKLQQAQERLFQFALYVTLWGENPEELSGSEAVVRSILEAKMVYVKPANFQQDTALMSVMPYDRDLLNISTNLDTEAVATTFPFVSSDLTTDQGILYGINRHNNSLILFDRFSLPNANMVVFGQSGGGKSYAMKLQILRSLMMGVDVLVIDPENEYQYLAQSTAGTFVSISLTSKFHINPFGLPPPIEGESPADVLRSHMLELVGLLRMMLGGKLTPEQEAVLDQAISETYAARGITPESDFSQIAPPLLADFIMVLGSLQGGQELATRIKKFTEGSFRGFLDQPTNVELASRLTVFSIRDLEEELRPIAMYVILHYIWTVVRSSLKQRFLVVDEAWWMMRHEEGGSFLLSIAKRARKYYLGLTTITQDVNDFMQSSYGAPIITNSSLQLLFKQSPATIDAIANYFHLTDEEKYLLLEASVGEGLFFAGLKHVAIKVVASYTEDQIITSDPEQLLAIRRAKQELGPGQ